MPDIAIYLIGMLAGYCLHDSLKVIGSLIIKIFKNAWTEYKKGR